MDRISHIAASSFLKGLTAKTDSSGDIPQGGLDNLMSRLAPASGWWPEPVPNKSWKPNRINPDDVPLGEKFLNQKGTPVWPPAELPPELWPLHLYIPALEPPPEPKLVIPHGPDDVRKHTPPSPLDPQWKYERPMLVDLMQGATAKNENQVSDTTPYEPLKPEFKSLMEQMGAKFNLPDPASFPSVDERRAAYEQALQLEKAPRPTDLLPPDKPKAPAFPQRKIGDFYEEGQSKWLEAELKVNAHNKAALKRDSDAHKFKGDASTKAKELANFYTQKSTVLNQLLDSIVLAKRLKRDVEVAPDQVPGAKETLAIIGQNADHSLQYYKQLAGQEKDIQNAPYQPPMSDVEKHNYLQAVETARHFQSENMFLADLRRAAKVATENPGKVPELVALYQRPEVQKVLTMAMQGGPQVNAAGRLVNAGKKVTGVAAQAGGKALQIAALPSSLALAPVQSIQTNVFGMMHGWETGLESKAAYLYSKQLWDERQAVMGLPESPSGLLAKIKKDLASARALSASPNKMQSTLYRDQVKQLTDKLQSAQRADARLRQAHLNPVNKANTITSIEQKLLHTGGVVENLAGKQEQIAGSLVNPLTLEAKTATLQASPSFTTMMLTAAKEPGMGWMDKGWGPFKAKWGLGMAGDIAAGSVISGGAAGTIAGRLAGEEGSLYNTSMANLLRNTGEPALERVAKVLETTVHPVSAVTHTGPVKSLLESAATKIKGTGLSEDLARILHARPLMTDAEKLINSEKNIATNIGQGSAQSYVKELKAAEIGGKEGKVARDDIVHALYDHNPKLADDIAINSGQESWLHTLKGGMADISRGEVAQGKLSNVRTGYFPGVMMEKQPGRASKLFNYLAREKQLPSTVKEVSPNVRAGMRAGETSQFGAPRGNKTLSAIQAEHPYFSKDINEALRRRKLAGENSILSNRMIKTVPGGVDETPSVIDKMLAKAEPGGSATDAATRIAAGTHTPEDIKLVSSLQGKAIPLTADEIKTMPLVELKTTPEFKAAQKEVTAEMGEKGLKPLPYTAETPIADWTNVVVKKNLAAKGMGGVNEGDKIWELEKEHVLRGFEKEGRVAGPAMKEKMWMDRRTHEFLQNPKTGLLKGKTRPTSWMGKEARNSVDFFRKWASVGMGPSYIVRRNIGDVTRAYEGGLLPSVSDLRLAHRITAGKPLGKGSIKLAGGGTMPYKDVSRVLKGLNPVGESSLLLKEAYKNPWIRGWRGVERGLANPLKRGEFIKGLRVTGTPGGAQEALNRVGFNFRDFAPWEKHYPVTGVPFYNYARKNVPMQLSTLLHSPGRMAPIYSPIQAMSLSGQGPLTDLEMQNTAQYIGDAGYTPTGATFQNEPLYMKPPVPMNQLLSFMSPFGGDTSALSFMANPALRMLGQHVAGGGERVISPTLAAIAKRIPFLKVQETTEKSTGLPTYSVSQDAYNILTLFPEVQAMNQLTNPSITTGQRLLKASQYLTGTPITPVDFPKQYGESLYQAATPISDTLTAIGKRGRIDVSPAPQAKPLPEKLPITPQTTRKWLKKNKLPITAENVARVQAAYAQSQPLRTLISPLAGSTLEDVQNAYKRGYVYSYNRPLMTPEQIAAKGATGGGGGGGGYHGHGGGGGGSRSGGGRAKSFPGKKALKKKFPALKSVSIPAAAFNLAAPPAPTAPLKAPAGTPGAKAPSSMSGLKLAIMAGGGGGQTKAPSTKVPTTKGTGLPADLAAGLEQVMANFFASSGGANPANLASLRAMLARQGISSPEVMALIQALYTQMAGGVPVAG
jgi:hypothetical protein